MQNFLDAVLRAKDRSKLHAVADGVASAALCHYANASYRLNRVIQMDPKTGMAAGDRERRTSCSERRGRSPYQIPEKV
ncbi:MAG: hypothetical protein R2748_32645 [Bryobacterales bacterium]